MARLGSSKDKDVVKVLVEPLEPRQMLANVTAGFTDSTYVSGLNRPTAMSFAPDGRLFVSLQDGKIVVVKNGQLLPTPALKITVNNASERGVQSTAFDPDFVHNHFLYLFYTAISPAHNRVSRFTVNGDIIDPASEHILLDMESLTASYHNGGALHFGEDGKLYISVGENTRATLARSMTSLLGKVLRMNTDGSIPTDNPFYKTATGQYRLIYDIGFRNPFTFAIEPGTNRLFINDVGESTYEEVNRDSGHGGNNFGWPSFEGPGNDPHFTDPLYYYHHQPGCAVVGGVFYPGSGGTFPAAYAGSYLFADHCDGIIQALNPNTGKIIAKVTTGGIAGNADLDIGPDGALYYLERTYSGPDGRVGRIQFNGAGTSAPTITQDPKSLKVAKGSPAKFDVGVTGTTPFQYQWRKNNVSIPGATSESYSIGSTTSADAGQYSVVVTNSKGSDTSNAATLTVTVNQAPLASINLPVSTLTYHAGDTITYTGTANDPQDGTLAGSAFTWQVDFHHDTHLHPFIPPTTGVTGGKFVIPRRGEVSSNTWYEILLTVEDSDGNTTSLKRDIYPKKSKITVTSNVTGLSLTLDGEPRTTPIDFTGVEHFLRDISAPATQTLNGKTYSFVSWSDGGAASHTISTPSANTAYTATYKVKGSAGTGVIGDYYNNIDFTGTHVSRIEPVINFKYEDGSPDPNITRDTFSARWTGLVKADQTATYTFYALVDDGVRLWVGNHLLIDKFTVTNKANEYSGSVALIAGKSYELRMDYFESTGNSQAELRWSTPSKAKQIVPQTSLYPVPLVSATPTPGGKVLASADSYVRNGSSSDIAFGSVPSLIVKQSGTPDFLRETYLKFDISNFTTINSAKLQLFGSIQDATATNISTRVFGAADTSWNESTLTFNNRPATSGGAIATTVITDNTPRLYTWDITSYIKAQKAAGHNAVTLVLRNAAYAAPYVIFNSREASSNKPQLVIA